MRVYYAHPIGFYGTDKEARHLELIRKFFPNADVVNPSDPQYAEEYKATGGVGMEYWCDLVRSCDAVVAAPFEDGEHGMGVWRELETMARRKGPTLEIVDSFSIRVIDFAEIRPLSVVQTRWRNAEIKEGRMKP